MTELRKYGPSPKVKNSSKVFVHTSQGVDHIEFVHVSRQDPNVVIRLTISFYNPFTLLTKSSRPSLFTRAGPVKVYIREYSSTLRSKLRPSTVVRFINEEAKSKNGSGDGLDLYSCADARAVIDSLDRFGSVPQELGSFFATGSSTSHNYRVIESLDDLKHDDPIVRVQCRRVNLPGFTFKSPRKNTVAENADISPEEERQVHKLREIINSKGLPPPKPQPSVSATTKLVSPPPKPVLEINHAKQSNSPSVWPPTIKDPASPAAFGPSGGVAKRRDPDFFYSFKVENKPANATPFVDATQQLSVEEAKTLADHYKALNGPRNEVLDPSWADYFNHVDKPVDGGKERWYVQVHRKQLPTCLSSNPQDNPPFENRPGRVKPRPQVSDDYDEEQPQRPFYIDQSADNELRAATAPRSQPNMEDQRPERQRRAVTYELPDRSANLLRSSNNENSRPKMYDVASARRRTSTYRPQFSGLLPTPNH